MAQSTVQTLEVDKARQTENVATVKRVFPSYQVHIIVKIEEIRGFLDRYAAAMSLDLRQTQHLETLQKNLRDQFWRMETTWDTMKGDVVDRYVFDRIEGWVTDTEEEVKNTLLDSEVFMEVRETMLSIEQEVGEDPPTGPAGSDVVLQVTEATSSTQ